MSAATTEQANAELIRRAYAAFNTADLQRLSEAVDKDASWLTPGHSPIAGLYEGRDAVFGQFGRYGGETDGTFKAELLQVFTSEDGRVIGLHHNSAVRQGKRLDTDCCVVFELKAGRVISGREHFLDLNNWDEFWS